MKEARGKLSAQAKKLLDRQEKVEDSLRRDKESRPREQERGRKGRPEARSQSSDPTTRQAEDSNRYILQLCIFGIVMRGVEFTLF